MRVGLRLRCGVLAAALVTAGCVAEGTGTPQPSRDPSGTSGMARTSASPPPKSFTLVATGDILPHDELWSQARRDASEPGELDFRPLFADVRPVVRGADLAICHMETPFAPRGGPYEGYPTFASPPAIADALAWLGYDACSTASNHTLDQGFEGVTRTLRVFGRAGIAAYGSSASARKARRPNIIEVRGVRIGLLAYTFSFNGIPEPEGKSWIADRIDPDEIRADARAARRAGAELVFVSVHWGEEYEHDVTARQRELASGLLASPTIDLLIGHHAHVVQPIERIDGEWAAYGLGNQVAAHETPVPANHEGALVRFTFTERQQGWRVTKAEYLPTYVTDAYPVRLLNVPRTLADSASASVPRKRLETALRRTNRVVDRRGGAGNGLTMIRPGTE